MLVKARFPSPCCTVAKLTDFCHTGGLEVYHSLVLKYCPKREHFSYKCMVARIQLAALDNNYNTGRKQAVIKEGERKGEACFPKMHKQWVVSPREEKLCLPPIASSQSTANG